MLHIALKEFLHISCIFIFKVYFLEIDFFFGILIFIGGIYFQELKKKKTDDCILNISELSLFLFLNNPVLQYYFFVRYFSLILLIILLNSFCNFTFVTLYDSLASF